MTMGKIQTEATLYYVTIIMFHGKSQGPIRETTIHWKDMQLDHLMRWNWYFEYRAALLKVENPKKKVILKTGNYKADLRTRPQIAEKIKRDRIITCKRMVTRIQNAIQEYEREQALLLLPNFENPKYLRTIQKLEAYKTELKGLKS